MFFRQDIRKLQALRNEKGLIKSLEWNDEARHVAAIEALGAVGGTLSIIPLSERLQCRNAKIIQACAKALGVISGRVTGEHRKTIAVALVSALKSSAYLDKMDADKAAMDALLAMGAVAEESVFNLASDVNEQQARRVMAVRLLGGISSDAARVHLVGLCETADASFLEEIVTALGNFPGESTVMVLLRLLDNAPAEARPAVVRALIAQVEKGMHFPADSIIALFSAQPAGVFKNVLAELLGALGDPAALEALGNAINQAGITDSKPMSQAMQSLGQERPSREIMMLECGRRLDELAATQKETPEESWETGHASKSAPLPVDKKQYLCDYIGKKYSLETAEAEELVESVLEVAHGGQ